MTKQMRNADRPLEHRIAAAIGRLARGDRRARIPDDAAEFEDGTFAPGEVTHWAEMPKGPGA